MKTGTSTILVKTNLNNCVRSVFLSDRSRHKHYHISLCCAGFYALTPFICLHVNSNGAGHSVYPAFRSDHQILAL